MSFKLKKKNPTKLINSNTSQNSGYLGWGVFTKDGIRETLYLHFGGTYHECIHFVLNLNAAHIRFEHFNA